MRCGVTKTISELSQFSRKFLRLALYTLSLTKFTLSLSAFFKLYCSKYL